MEIHQTIRTNECILANCEKTLVDRKKIILDDFQLAKAFNNYYINTVETNSGNKPLQIINLLKDDITAISKVINTDHDHPSAKQIRSTIEP